MKLVLSVVIGFSTFAHEVQLDSLDFFFQTLIPFAKILKSQFVFCLVLLLTYFECEMSHIKKTSASSFSFSH